MTPYVVVNWLYQAPVGVYGAFPETPGTNKFTATGAMSGPGSGEVLLWWGSHLGAVRDQGLIA